MKKIFLLLTIAFASLTANAQVVIPRQDIHYNVNYRWGIVDVNIAKGKVTVESNGSWFSGTLDGTSIPWEGKIICVSDTLQANMSYADGRISERVDYQNGWYRHVPVSLFNSGRYNPDESAYFKNIAGGGEYDASHDSMEAITVTSDMLGMYYFAHALNFPGFKPGDRFVIPIEGPYSREVVITYDGQGVYTADGVTYPTYNCTFEYSYGGRMSGFPVECRISATDRIPVFLSASLPVGHVEMLYTPY